MGSKLAGKSFAEGEKNCKPLSEAGAGGGRSLASGGRGPIRKNDIISERGEGAITTT